MNQHVRFLMSLVTLTLLASAGLGEDPWKLGVPGIGLMNCVVSPDSKLAAVSYSDNSIRLWDLATGRELRRLIGHNGPPERLSFSPDGKRLVSSGEGETSYDAHASVRVWSIETGENLFRYPSSGGLGASLYHPSGKHFLASVRERRADASELYYLAYFDAESFRLTTRVPADSTPFWELAFSTDGRQLIGGHSYKTFLWDVIAGKQTVLWNNNAAIRKTFGRTPAAFSPDGRKLALVDYYSRGGEKKGDVILYDCPTLHEVRRFTHLDPFQFGMLQFTPDGRRLGVSANAYYCEWEVDTGQRLRTLRLGNIFAISPDSRLLLGRDYMGSLTVWDFARGEMTARLVAMKEEDCWAVETTAGYFDVSPGYRPELNSYELRRETNKYYERYHQPQLGPRLLAGTKAEDAERLPTGSRPPDVQLELVRVTGETAELLVSAQAFGERTAVQGVVVSVNGRELDSIRTKSIVRKPPQPTAASWRTEVPFPPGENSANVRAVARDNFGQQSKPASLVIERSVKVKPVPGRLFVLTVGVSVYRRPQFNLQFCHADAQALADALKAQQGRAFGDVQVQVYTDKQASIANVEDGLAWLERSCTPSDVAVVLFSGHGVRGERGLYYMTYEADVNGLQYTCVNWETVASAMKKIRAKQVLFLTDTCHAGSFAKSQLVPQQELADSLRKAAGIMVFASSRGEEQSLEDEEWQHGAFCKALLEALAGKADADRDGKITVAELHDYTVRRVAALTDDQQHPELPQLGDFDPQLVLAYVVPARAPVAEPTAPAAEP